MVGWSFSLQAISMARLADRTGRDSFSIAVEIRMPLIASPAMETAERKALPRLRRDGLNRGRSGVSGRGRGTERKQHFLMENPTCDSIGTPSHLVILSSGEASMNKYFFHFRRGAEISPDQLGIYLPSDEDAFDEAVRTWRDLISAAATEGERLDSAIEIADASGNVLVIVPLGYAARLTEKAP